MALAYLLAVDILTKYKDYMEYIIIVKPYRYEVPITTYTKFINIFSIKKTQSFIKQQSIEITITIRSFRILESTLIKIS